jgi:ABC-type multidrug transport system ATPase subunit
MSPTKRARDGALLGPNAADKTPTMRMLVGLARRWLR